MINVCRRMSASKRTCDLVSGFVHVRVCSHVLVVGGWLRETFFFFVSYAIPHVLVMVGESLHWYLVYLL